MTAVRVQVCCNYGLCGRCQRKRGAWRSSTPVAIQHASSEDCFLCHSPGATTVTWMRVACTDDKLFRDRCLFRRVDGGGLCVERRQADGEVQEAFLRIVGIERSLGFVQSESQRSLVTEVSSTMALDAEGVAEGPGKASSGQDGAAVSLRVRAGVGTDLAELYVVKEGAGDAGEIALLEKSTKGRRASLPALARQSSAFDEAAAWLVREWAEPDVETAAAATSSARCEVYAAPSGIACDAGGSLPGAVP